MKAVVQRVTSAKVVVDDETVGEISHGLLTLLGVAAGDTEVQLQKTIDKILDLRIFPDSDGKMNLSLEDVGGEHLIVSQFTLLGNCSKGRRPNFTQAEQPDKAQAMYDKALEISARRVPTQGGRFGADMKVSLLNDGPVTLIVEF